MYFVLLDFNFGGGSGGFNSGNGSSYNFFGGGGGGNNSGSGGSGGGNTAAAGGFPVVNTTSSSVSIAAPLESLYSTLPHSTQSHIFAATATNPGPLPTYSNHLRAATNHGFVNGGQQLPPMYHPQQLQQFLPTASGQMVPRSGGIVIKKEPTDYYMDVIESKPFSKAMSITHTLM